MATSPNMDAIRNENNSIAHIENAESDVEKWDINSITRILRLYGAHRILWDVHDVDNRNRKLRRAALIDIAAAMGNQMTSAQVARKLNILRATYRYERRRIKQRIRKGIGAKTKLKWFTLADSFLRELPTIRKARSRLDKHSDSGSDLEDEMVLTIEPDIVISMETETIKREDNEVDTTSVDLDVDKEQFQSRISEDIRKQSSETDSKPEEVKPLKTKWTSEDSMKLVSCLKTRPILWLSTPIGSHEDENEALQFIADMMKMPTERVQYRVAKFIQICEDALKEMRTNPDYKPPYFWWNIAESFMTNKENQLDCDNFVDTNAIFPATPMQHDLENVPTPINPIPSVSMPSLLDADESDESLQELLLETKTESVDVDDVDVELSSSTQATKIVYNGLTDDLLEGKWSLRHSVKFLRLYGTHRCLWDLKDPDYRSRELRSAAIEDIAAAMGHSLNANYVAKKIKIFRITYMQHRKRILEAIKSGKEPEIQLRWFPLADSFLRPHIGLRSIKEQNLEIPQFDYQYVMANLNLIDPELLNDFRDKLPDATGSLVNDKTNETNDSNCSIQSLKTEKCEDYNEDI